MQIQGLTWRLPLIQGRWDAVTDKYTGQRPGKLPRGNAARIELALFKTTPGSSALYGDLGNVTSFGMVMRQGSATGTFLKEVVIAREDFDNDEMTWEQWLNDEAQQIVIDLAPEDTNYAPTSGLNYPVYFAFQAITTAGPIFFGNFTANIVEEGIGTAGSPTPGDPIYLSAAESDARFYQDAASAEAVTGPRQLHIGADYLTIWSPARSAAVRVPLIVP